MARKSVEKASAKGKDASLAEAVRDVVGVLAAREKKQDELVGETRLFIRECANAIKALHEDNYAAARAATAKLDAQVKALKEKGGGEFDGMLQTPLQEYVEIKCLLALLEERALPSPRELGVDGVSFLNGLADCVGELRRALQIALRKNDHARAEYLFAKMNELYDELMTVKFSASLVGGLRRKTDVLRGQLEQARSEMLRAK
jgi:translin